MAVMMADRADRAKLGRGFAPVERAGNLGPSMKPVEAARRGPGVLNSPARPIAPAPSRVESERPSQQRGLPPNLSSADGGGLVKRRAAQDRPGDQAKGFH